ncbi:MAG: glycosyltransferase family 2 protein [Chlamydiales bacterium]|nr:glycosyltransferase family 2 protein [Chlamydiales bacterium]
MIYLKFLRLTQDILHIFDSFGLIYFFLMNTFFAVLVMLSFPQIYRRFIELRIEGMDHLLTSEALPPISILVPVHNEEKTIIDSVHALIDLAYAKKELILVNDGSTDSSLEIMKKEFELVEVPQLFSIRVASKPIKKLYRSTLFSNLLLIDKENGGKGDSLNAGMNFASSPLFMAMDSDTVIEKDALLRMIRPFITRKDVVAEGGTIRILNGCKVEKGKILETGIPKNHLAGIQVGEYLRAFLYGRLGWNVLGGNFIVSGAFGLFDREKVIEVGGYQTDTVGEDFEISVRLLHHFRKKNRKCFIGFVPDPVAWTDVPEDLKTLGRQRERWHRGLIDIMWKYRSMIFNPRYGMTGFIAMPYLLFGELLQPIFELLYYFFIIIGLVFGIVPLKYMLLFFGVTMGISFILTISAVTMEMVTFRRYKTFSGVLRLFFYSIIENFGYRQCYLFWKLWAFKKYFRKDLSW